MLAHDEEGVCRGVSGKASICIAPGCCATGDWVACREKRPERARHAVRALASEQVAGRVAPERADELACAVAEAVFKIPAAELLRYHADRLIAALVGDLLSEVLSGRVGPVPDVPWRSDESAHPSPPDGWTWEGLLDALHKASTCWVMVHGVRGSVAHDLAQDACSRLYMARMDGVEIPFPVGWAMTVYRSRARDAARGKAHGPFPPRIAAREIVARDLAALREVRSPEEEAAHRELVVRIPALLDLLPPPYRQVARLQYLLGWSRRRIGAWLPTWCRIEMEGIRTLILRTHRMLTAIGAGKDPRQIWSGRYDRKKSRWFSRPPPPPFSPL